MWEDIQLEDDLCGHCIKIYTGKGEKKLLCGCAEKETVTHTIGNSSIGKSQGNLFRSKGFLLSSNTAEEGRGLCDWKYLHHTFYFT